MNGLMQNQTFLYAIAFTIFVVLAYWRGRKPILGWLDTEILKIRAELDEAQRLRTEAETTLADYKKKQAEAIVEANAIIAHAKEEAVRLKEEAATKLKASMERHEQQALERIHRAEADAVADVRQATVDMAMQLATQILVDKVDATTATALTDQAISAIAKPAKAEAA